MTTYLKQQLYRLYALLTSALWRLSTWLGRRTETAPTAGILKFDPDVAKTWSEVTDLTSKELNHQLMVAMAERLKPRGLAAQPGLAVTHPGLAMDSTTPQAPVSQQPSSAPEASTYDITTMPKKRKTPKVLTRAEREQVVVEFLSGKYHQTALATMFDVSESTVTRILDAAFPGRNDK